MTFLYCLDGYMLLNAFVLISVGFTGFIAHIIQLNNLHGFFKIEQSSCYYSLLHIYCLYWLIDGIEFNIYIGIYLLILTFHCLVMAFFATP